MTTSFCISPRAKRPAKPKAPPVSDLTKVAGIAVNGGKSVEWAHGNSADELTPAEIAAIKRVTGCKRVKVFRATRIKALMRTRTVAQIAKELKCSERTVWGVRAALLSTMGEWQDENALASSQKNRVK